MSAWASDGTPLVPRYYTATERTAPQLMQVRERAAADAAAGLARLEQIAAEQQLATAQARLNAARERVCAHDTARLAVAIRQWCLRAAPPP